MKVKDFITELQKLPQNLEIVFYNGLVEDVQPISNTFIIEELKKHSLKYYEDGFLLDWYNKNKKDYSLTPSPDELNTIKQKALKKYKSSNEYVIPYDNFDTKDWFNKRTKKRVLLQAGIAGKTYTDRLGKITY